MLISHESNDFHWLLSTRIYRYSSCKTINLEQAADLIFSGSQRGVMG